MSTWASEPEPEPPEPVHFARSRSRSRRKVLLGAGAGAGAGMLPRSRSRSRSRPKMSRLRIPASNPSYQTVVHLTPPTHYHAQWFEQYLNFESLTCNDLQWTYLNPSQHDSTFSKSLCTNPPPPKKKISVFLEKFCDPFARYIVWSMLSNGAPTTGWFSTPLFSRLIYGGGNDLWSVLPHVFFDLRFWLSPI